MKKFMSAILAIIMMFSIAVPVFAAEGEVKNVDNTFDNFEPAPGKKAPDNWYDPYCYEADGRINKYCLNQGEYVTAYYCPEYRKIFTIKDMGRKTIEAHFESIKNADGSTTTYYYPEYVISYRPYEVYLGTWTILYGLTSSNPEIITYENSRDWYCPYCGALNYEYYTGQENYDLISAHYTHTPVTSVIYGYYHDECGTFVASGGFSIVTSDDNPFSFQNNCTEYAGCFKEVDINNVKLYRFLSEEQRTAEYSFIFTETEKDFGDGKDGNLEDLKKYDGGDYNEWNSPDNPYQKLTFWQKIVKFFANIMNWFKNLFK